VQARLPGTGRYGTADAPYVPALTQHKLPMYQWDADGVRQPLEEARAQEGIGNSHLQDGNPGQAAAQLRQALAIYQRIGSPGAQRVRETLRQYGLQQAAHQPTHD
jgi:hypothetical protein